MIDDEERCYRAASARDTRFDGRFVMAVATTGIYCRPSCPARTPRRANVRFFATAASARAAGFRACLRCYPDASPGSPDWNVRGDLAARAMRAILDGEVDRTGVAGLAQRLHVSTRHLERVLVAELGVGPLAVARAQRCDSARTLIETTDLPFARIALVAGFGSLRQFNDSVRDAFARTPTQLRAARGKRSSGATGAGACEAIELRLAVRSPFDGAGVLDFLARRAIEGIECVEDGRFTRALVLPGGHAVVELRPEDDHVACTVTLSELSDLGAAVRRCRALFDLDADPVGIDAALAADELLAPLVAQRPGLRSPGGVDGFEIAVRAILGQVVTVEAGRRVVEQLVRLCDVRLHVEHDQLAHVFPDAAAVAAADLDQLAIPATRRRALHQLACAVEAGMIDLAPGADRDEQRAALLAIPGIGVWTASYVLMRATGSPDEFLPGDAAVRAAARAHGIADTPQALEARADVWRPWRSYALHHLWNTRTAPAQEPT